MGSSAFATNIVVCTTTPWHLTPGGQKGLSIFHKKYDQHNKRHRQGYADDLGMSLSRVAKVR